MSLPNFPAKERFAHGKFRAQAPVRGASPAPVCETFLASPEGVADFTHSPTSSAPDILLLAKLAAGGVWPHSRTRTARRSSSAGESASSRHAPTLHSERVVRVRPTAGLRVHAAGGGGLAELRDGARRILR